MYILILAALAAAIRAGLLYAQTKDDRLEREAQGIPLGDDDNADERRAKRLSLIWATGITIAATIMAAVDTVKMDEDSAGVIVQFVLKTMFFAAAPWTFGGAWLGAFIGFGRHHKVPKWLLWIVTIGAGIVLGIVGFASFTATHPWIAALISIPLLIVLIPIGFLVGWAIKNALGHAMGEAIVKHVTHAKSDAEKGAEKAAIAFLTPFVATGDLSKPEMLRLLKDDVAYTQFHAEHWLPSRGRQQQQYQPPQPPPPPPQWGQPPNPSQPRRRRR